MPKFGRCTAAVTGNKSSKAAVTRNDDGDTSAGFTQEECIEVSSPSAG